MFTENLIGDQLYPRGEVLVDCIARVKDTEDDLRRDLMEIGLTYSSKDPRQIQTRDFVRKFIKDRGILAHLVENEQPVKVLTISINGCCISDNVYIAAAGKRKVQFPTIDNIARALERNIWSL